MRKLILAAILSLAFVPTADAGRADLLALEYLLEDKGGILAGEIQCSYATEANV